MEMALLFYAIYVDNESMPRAHTFITFLAKMSSYPCVFLRWDVAHLGATKPELVTIDSHRSLHIADDYEPLPTSAPRPRQSVDENVRKLPQLTLELTIFAPLSTLPSGSRVAARQHKDAAKDLDSQQLP